MKKDIFSSARHAAGTAGSKDPRLVADSLGIMVVDLYGSIYGYAAVYKSGKASWPMASIGGYHLTGSLWKPARNMKDRLSLISTEGCIPDTPAGRPGSGKVRIPFIWSPKRCLPSSTKKQTTGSCSGNLASAPWISGKTRGFISWIFSRITKHWTGKTESGEPCSPSGKSTEGIPW